MNYVFDRTAVALPQLIAEENGIPTHPADENVGVLACGGYGELLAVLNGHKPCSASRMVTIRHLRERKVPRKPFKCGNKEIRVDKAWLDGLVRACDEAGVRIARWDGDGALIYRTDSLPEAALFVLLYWGGHLKKTKDLSTRTRTSLTEEGLFKDNDFHYMIGRSLGYRHEDIRAYYQGMMLQDVLLEEFSLDTPEKAAFVRKFIKLHNPIFDAWATECEKRRQKLMKSRYVKDIIDKLVKMSEKI